MLAAIERHAIIFECSDHLEDLEKPVHGPRAAKACLGTYNVRLVDSLLCYNGIEVTDGDDFSMMWGSSPDVDDITPTSIFQRCNHFPYSKKIVGNKGELARIIQGNPNYAKMPKFFPRSWVLPRDRNALYNAMKAAADVQFISKPPGGSMGAGIRLVKFDGFYSIPSDHVVGEYVPNSLCIDSFKVDCRVYVLVTSFAPLRAFVYKDGLARFATSSYTRTSTNVFAHLTNAGLNRKSQNYSSEFKWKLTELLDEIEHRWRKPATEVFDTICMTVARSLALVQPAMAPTSRRTPIDPFFEIFGFDILLDKEFRAWMLEINTYPCLGTEEDVDFSVKGPMLAGAFSIAGVLDLSHGDLLLLQREMRKVGVEGFDQALVQAEDERNRRSGNMFVRIFPSSRTAELQAILVVPRVVPHVRRLNPKRIGGGMSVAQAAVLLCAFLQSLGRTLEKRASRERLGRFLEAQGYRRSGRVAVLRSMLENFCEQVVLRNAVKEDTLSARVCDELLGYGDDYVLSVLDHSPLAVPEIAVLFGE